MGELGQKYSDFLSIGWMMESTRTEGGIVRWGQLGEKVTLAR